MSDRTAAAPRSRARRAALAVVAVAVALAGCSREASGPVRSKEIDVVVAAASGSPAERHFQWFVTNVRSWAPGYAVALVPRTKEHSVDRLVGERVKILKVEPAEAVALVPALAVLDQPFLFDTEEQADRVIDAVVRPFVERALHERGLQLLSLTEGEPRVLDTSIFPEAPEIRIVPLTDDPAAQGLKPRRAALLDSGGVPGLVVAPSSWYDALPPRDQDAFKRAYRLADARADSRRDVAARLAKLAEDPQKKLLAMPVDERRAWRRVRDRYDQETLRRLGPDAQQLHAAIEAARNADAPAPGAAPSAAPTPTPAPAG